MSITELYKFFEKSNGVSIDTRSIEDGNLFFALKGPNFDGHAYIKLALDSGASFAIADDESYKDIENVIVVDNVLDALQNLARYHRCMLNIPVIGITGSNGKTTTKELITCVLATKYNVFATKGNYNNHLGVPISILSIKKHHEIAIIEMGANHIGEIKFLSEISMPSIGLITNIGKAHLEGFGSIEGVRKGKTELYSYIKSTKGTIIYNQDDILLRKSLPSETVNYSYSNEDVELESEYPFVVFKYRDTVIRSNLSGTYNRINMVAAIKVGEYFGLSIKDLKLGIENYLPDNNRSQIKETDNNTLILDAYNANPSSMLESIRYFNSHPGEKKSLIIGHMLELGKNSKQEHIDLVDFISRYRWDKVFLVGVEFLKMGKEVSYDTFETTSDLVAILKEQKLVGHTILLKGSRGVALEKCIDFL